MSELDAVARTKADPNRSRREDQLVAEIERLEAQGSGLQARLAVVRRNEAEALRDDVVRLCTVLGHLRAIVDEQARDRLLWPLGAPPTSHLFYVQDALRRLHKAIERATDPKEADYPR